MLKLFDFKCNACDHIFEEMIDSTDELFTGPCPGCEVEGNFERLLSQGAIVSGIAGRSFHMPQGFKDVMSKIKQAHPRGKLDSEFL